jgi:hypothetical protein
VVAAAWLEHACMEMIHVIEQQPASVHEHEHEAEAEHHLVTGLHCFVAAVARACARTHACYFQAHDT